MAASLSLALLAGCQVQSFDPGRAVGLSRAQRETDLQARWRGQPYDALVGALGQPTMRMNIPGDRPLEWVAVFGVTDERSGCIDAFTVLRGERAMVIDYYCR